MNDEDNGFENYDNDDNNGVSEMASETINVRAGRQRRSWRDIERLREQREMDRLSNQDNWFDELDRAM